MTKLRRLLLLAALLLAPLFSISPVAPPQVAGQAGPALTVRAVDASGAAKPGACYGVGYSAGPIFSNQTFCDNDDGANDGVATFAGLSLSPGLKYTLTMIVAPRGYLVGQKQAFDASQTDLTFTVRKGGMRLQIFSVDQHGKPITGACFHVFPASRLGGFGQNELSYVCAGKTSKGVATLDGTPEGRYVIQPGQQPDNYAAVENIQNVKVQQDTSSAAHFTFTPAGSVTLTILAPDGSPVTTSGCWSLEGVEGSKTASTLVCGPDQTGAFIGQNVPVGSFTLTSFFGGLPKGMALPKKQTTIVVKRAKQTTATLQLASGGQGVAVSALDLSGQPTTFTCINAYFAKRGKPFRQAGSVCSQQSGTATLWGLDPGDYFVQVTQFGTATDIPASPLKKVKVKAGKETDETIQAGPGATLKVVTRDAKKKPVKGACIGATTDLSNAYAQYSRIICDEDDGNQDGVITFAPIPANAKITVSASLLPSGWALPLSQSVKTDPNGSTTITLTVARGASALTIHRNDDKGAPQPNSCFQIFTAKNGKAADLVAQICDTFDDGGADGVTHAALGPGEYVAREAFVASSDGKLAPDTEFTIANGQNLDLTIPPAAPVASPIASPVASPVASPAATPPASPTSAG